MSFAFTLVAFDSLFPNIFLQAYRIILRQGEEKVF